MKGKYWAVAIPLLLVFCLSARGRRRKLADVDRGGLPSFRPLAASKLSPQAPGRQIEMRPREVTGGTPAGSSFPRGRLLAALAAGRDALVRAPCRCLRENLRPAASA